MIYVAFADEPSDGRRTHIASLLKRRMFVKRSKCFQFNNYALRSTVLTLNCEVAFSQFNNYAVFRLRCLCTVLIETSLNELI